MYTKFTTPVFFYTTARYHGRNMNLTVLGVFLFGLDLWVCGTRAEGSSTGGDPAACMDYGLFFPWGYLWAHGRLSTGLGQIDTTNVMEFTWYCLPCGGVQGWDISVYLDVIFHTHMLHRGVARHTGFRCGNPVFDYHHGGCMAGYKKYLLLFGYRRTPYYSVRLARSVLH
ncbi:uncharacterized protein B0I36DRAFT_153210 [Microdochium trichocladiopsis]|uniref:Uncharacterized protein n=1 Tax=Microdochium trichocladiopsis TaxID=1682393 RepID=A0A9P9BQN1_9PEZI|nr:uncharacterized protein B0I36DRAFT_153210 [Microdochium trichocladiopsis]KAH7026052.1 hypothetical protein B0I36DRAFT_153210 [Microdochium trichocladiopsis]